MGSLIYECIELEMLFEIYEETPIPAMFIMSELSISNIPQKILITFIKKINDIILTEGSNNNFISGSEKNLEWAIYTIGASFSTEMNPEITNESLNSCLHLIRLFTGNSSNIPIIYLKSYQTYVKIILLQVYNLFKSNFLMNNIAFNTSTNIFGTLKEILTVIIEFIIESFKKKGTSSNSKIALFFINFFLRLSIIIFSETNENSLIHKQLSSLAIDGIFYSLILKQYIDDCCPTEYWRSLTENFSEWVSKVNAVKSLSNFFLMITDGMGFGKEKTSLSIDSRVMKIIIDDTKLIYDVWLLLYNLELTSLDHIFNLSSKYQQEVLTHQSDDQNTSKKISAEDLRKENYGNCIEILSESIISCILIFSKICEVQNTTEHHNVMQINSLYESPNISDISSWIFCSNDRPSLNSIFALFYQFLFGVCHFFIRPENSNEVVECFSKSICQVSNLLIKIMVSKRIDEDVSNIVEDEYIKMIEFHLNADKPNKAILQCLFEKIGNILTNNFVINYGLFRCAYKLQLLFSDFYQNEHILALLIDNIYSLQFEYLSYEIQHNSSDERFNFDDFLINIKNIILNSIQVNSTINLFELLMGCIYNFLLGTTIDISSNPTYIGDRINNTSYSQSLDLLDSMISIFNPKTLRIWHESGQIFKTEHYGLLLLSLVDLKLSFYIEKIIILIEQYLEYSSKIISDYIQGKFESKIQRNVIDLKFVHLVVSISCHWLYHRFYYISQSKATKSMISIVQSCKDTEFETCSQSLIHVALLSRISEKYKSNKYFDSSKFQGVVENLCRKNITLEDFNSYIIDSSYILLITPLQTENKLLVYIINEFTSYHWIIDFIFEEVNYKIYDEFHLKTKDSLDIDCNQVVIRPHTDLMSHLNVERILKSTPCLESTIYKEDKYCKLYLDDANDQQGSIMSNEGFKEFKLPEILSEESRIRQFLATFICKDFIFERPKIKSIKSDGFIDEKNKCFSLITDLENIPNYNIIETLTFYFDDNENKEFISNDNEIEYSINFTHDSIEKFKKYLVESDDNLHPMTDDHEFTDYLLYTKLNTKIKFKFEMVKTQNEKVFNAFVIFLTNNNEINIKVLNKIFSIWKVKKNLQTMIYIIYILNDRMVQILSLNSNFCVLNPMPIKSGMVVEFKLLPSLITRSIYNHNFIYNIPENPNDSPSFKRAKLIKEIASIVNDDLTDELSLVFHSS